MSWAAYLVRTVDGTRGARLDIAGDGSWAIPLNGVEDVSVTVSKDQLRDIWPEWWSPWRGSVLLCRVMRDGSEVPWIAGPIVQPVQESRDTATITFQGIGALLGRRVVTDRDYLGTSARLSVSGATSLARSRARFTGMSLGTIAQEVVKLATDRAGGHIPIRYASPRETGSRLNERTYEGFNLANNGAFKRLTELSGVRNGPDIAFRPEWSDESRSRIQWAMFHGTAAQPAIAQAWTMDLDTTSSKSPVADVSVTTDAGGLTNRVYQTGAGEGAGTLIRAVQNAAQLSEGMPLLETVGSTSDSESAALLVEHAGATLDAGRGPVTQITVTVDGADPRAEIGRWRVGDAARLTLGDDWLTVPAGTTEKRIIAAKGGLDSAMADLEFQDDGPVEYEEIEN